MRRRTLISAWVTMLAVTSSAGAAGIRMYLADAVNNLVAFDPATRVAERIGTMPAQFTDIAFTPDGRLSGVTPSLLYEVGPLDGWSTLIGALVYDGPAPSGTMDALAFGPDGRLYGAGDDALIMIDTETAAASVVGGLSGFRSAGDLALAKDGRMLLTTDAGQLAEVYLNGGGASAIGALPYYDVFALAASPEGTIYGVRADNEILTIDPESGAATLMGKLQSDFLMGYAWGGGIPPAHAPEASVLVYLVVTAGWLAVRSAR